MLIDIPNDMAQIIMQIANHRGQSVQDFILMSAYEKALSLAYADESIWYISHKDGQIINELLDNPSPMNAKMQELLALTDDIQDLT